jgi:hypothetical protein
MKNARRITMLNALTTAGRITDQYESMRPSMSTVR